MPHMKAHEIYSLSLDRGEPTLAYVRLQDAQDSAHETHHATQ